MAVYTSTLRGSGSQIPRLRVAARQLLLTSGRQHITFVCFVAASEGTVTELTEIVANSTNPDAELPWVAFRGL